MKSPAIPPLPVALGALALGSLLANAAALAQVPDSFFPEMDPPGTEKKEDTREKTYVEKTPLRWELSRRFSEHVIEEYLPKFGAIVKRKPGTSDFTDWRTLGGQLFVSWSESREHQKTGTRPSDQDDWEKQHSQFLGGIKTGGPGLMLWRDGIAMESADFQKEADEAPGRFEEIRRNMKVTDPIWAKAIEVAAGGSGASWNREKLKEAQGAYTELRGKRDEVVSTYSAILWAYLYATKDKAEKPRNLLTTDEQVTLSNWKAAVSKYPLVQKIYTQPVQEWAKLLDAAFEADVKAWESMQKAFEPVKSGSIRASSPYKDCPWDKRVAECVQKTLDDLATAIAAAARKIEGADAKVAEDKSLTEKEYRRLLELSRSIPTEEWRKLELAEVRARTDEEVAEAARKIKEFRANAKKVDDESAKIKAEHKARRKALGIPPEDWAD
jgi:hypothetical protein